MPDTSAGEFAAGIVRVALPFVPVFLTTILVGIAAIALTAVACVVHPCLKERGRSRPPHVGRLSWQYVGRPFRVAAASPRSKRPRLARVAALVVAAGFSCIALTAQQPSGYDLLQQALAKERAAGQLEAAIALYQQIVRNHAANRPLAAKALVQLGRCYEKLARSEARQTYERLVRDYADQADLVAEARARLAALTASPPGGSLISDLVVRRVWADPDTDFTGAPSPDGERLTYVDWQTGDLAVYAVGSGKRRRLTDNPPDYSKGYAFASLIAPSGREVAYAWYGPQAANPQKLVVDLRLIGLNGSRRRVIYSNEDLQWIEPTDYSPDGKQLLATLSRGDRTNQIALIGTADGAVQALKTFDWRMPDRMRFSPDGTSIIYDFPPREDSPDRDVFLLATDGSREATLVEHQANDFVLEWMPDGRHVLFASNRTGTTDVWTIEVRDGKASGSPTLVKKDIGRWPGRWASPEREPSTTGCRRGCRMCTLRRSISRRARSSRRPFERHSDWRDRTSTQPGRLMAGSSPSFPDAVDCRGAPSWDTAIRRL